MAEEGVELRKGSGQGCDFSGNAAREARRILERDECLRYFVGGRKEAGEGGGDRERVHGLLGT